jgi:hypothetical protein
MDDAEEIESRRRAPESLVALALIACWVKWPRSSSADLALKDVRREYAEITSTRLSDAVVGKLVIDSLTTVFGIPILGKINRRLLVSRTRMDKIAAAYGLSDLLIDQPPLITSPNADLRILELMWSLPSKRRSPVR